MCAREGSESPVGHLKRHAKTEQAERGLLGLPEILRVEAAGPGRNHESGDQGDGQEQCEEVPDAVPAASDDSAEDHRQRNGPRIADPCLSGRHRLR